MKVVVTGATGFVGRYTVQSLLLNGYEVVSITTKKSIPKEFKNMLKGSQIVTINSLEDVSKRLIKNNCIIHCAWNNVQNTLAPSHYSHALEQIKFLEKLSVYEPKKLIITGTCSEFGLTTKPIRIRHILKQKNLFALRLIKLSMRTQELSLFGLVCSTCTAKGSMRNQYTANLLQLSKAVKWLSICQEVNSY